MWPFPNQERGCWYSMWERANPKKCQEPKLQTKNQQCIILLYKCIILLYKVAPLLANLSVPGHNLQTSLALTSRKYLPQCGTASDVPRPSTTRRSGWGTWLGTASAAPVKTSYVKNSSHTEWNVRLSDWLANIIYLLRFCFTNEPAQMTFESLQVRESPALTFLRSWGCPPIWPFTQEILATTPSSQNCCLWSCFISTVP